ncbi:6-pyruvoyl tetrahydropterin reductase [Marinobacter sp. R17]|uniref:6-pyruvoyl trahydropterin synthase family protein n=1 Tax=Marinobacter TaxID=2742 RepID=UPI000F4BFF5B|nr:MULTISPECIES: 6-carboxytetrahydropterin synthase [Marinobacter]ROU01835.1 6-pyruvoyl tetrahydropterin reductase [Marinobacter sp. R17]
MNHLFVDNLTVIDFAYLDHDRGLVGESWIVDIVLAGELDEQGMVFDFGSVKRTIKQVIDERVDHRLVVPADRAGAQLREHGDRVELEWPVADGSVITHGSPIEAVLPLPGERVVPSAVSKLLQDELRAVLPGNVTGIEVNLREEVIEGPYYHYVHGLKKHLGNCQRIAHGHRSRIQIQRNGARDQALERAWAKRWQDIYVGTEEDVTARFVEDDVSYLTFAYEANQGEFSLTLPADRVCLIDTDTTVELLAAYLADACKQQFPNDDIQVKAFEGVGKGAIALR